MQLAIDDKELSYCQIIEFPGPMAKPSQGHDPQKHGNWAQWAAFAVALLGSAGVNVYFHYAESSAKTSDEHVNALIDTKLNPVTDKINDHFDMKLAPVLSQLTDLAARVGKLEGRFEQLDADQKRITKIQLNKLSAQLTIARESQRQINVATLVNLGKSVARFSNSADQEISQLGWRTTMQIIDYRSFLNAALAPHPSKEDIINGPGGRNDFFMEFNVQRLPGVPGNFGFVGFGRRVLPEGSPEGALFLKRGNEGKANAAPEHIVVQAAGFALKLDGYHIRNAIIKGARIVYDGGPLVLENVYFVNCTFEMQSTRPTQDLANMILDSAPASFSQA